jgi:hypothetical protein
MPKKKDTRKGSRHPRPDGRKTKDPSPRQLKVLKARSEGKSFKEAGEIAGYPTANARQSAWQAIEGLRGRVAGLLEKHGLGEDVGIDKYLRPGLEATQTIFAQFEGKFTDKRELINWGARLRALDMLFKLHGSYPPLDPKEAAQFGVRVIRVDIPRPTNEWNQFVDVIPESALSRHGVHPGSPAPANGKPPVPTNGKPPTNEDK